VLGSASILTQEKYQKEPAMNATYDWTPSKEVVRKKIGQDYLEFRAAAKMWSAVYNSFQFGSAALSAAAALVLKTELVDQASRNDWGAVLAAAAALCITLLTAGRFKDKWEANRIAAFAVRDLSYAIEKANVNVDDILTTLQRIGLTRNNIIVGLPTALDIKPSSSASAKPPDPNDTDRNK
jgi:hypothetical protein